MRRRPDAVGTDIAANRDDFERLVREAAGCVARPMSRRRK
jgi:hypothetical protein